MSSSLSLIVKLLTFPPQIRAGFSASLVEMPMVLPTQFNVNPILLFSPLLWRSFLLPYTAAGGTDSRLKPPSGSGESAQDRKRGTQVRRKVFSSMQECDYYFFLIFLLFFWGGWGNESIIIDNGPIPGGSDTSLLFSFSPIDWISFFFMHHIHFLFSPTDHRFEFLWDQIK